MPKRAPAQKRNRANKPSGTMPYITACTQSPPPFVSPSTIPKSSTHSTASGIASTNRKSRVDGELTSHGELSPAANSLQPDPSPLSASPTPSAAYPRSVLVTMHLHNAALLGTPTTRTFAAAHFGDSAVYTSTGLGPGPMSRWGVTRVVTPDSEVRDCDPCPPGKASGDELSSSR